MLIGIFLFLKQIVDVIYELKVLDILMVVFALALIGVHIFKLLRSHNIDIIKKNSLKFLRKQIQFIDCAVLVLAILYVLSFLRDIHAIASFVKIESAFLIYILGRLYGSEIIGKGRRLAIAGYIIVYANLIYVVAEKLYIKQNGVDFPWEIHGLVNGGALYYYKTDLAIGLIIASIFIYVYGQVKIIKFITLYGATIFTIWDSKARMGKVILGGLLLVFLLRELFIFIKKTKQVEKDSKIILSKKKIGLLEIFFILVTVAIFIIFITIQITPIKQYDYYSLGISEELNDRLENALHERHIIWWDTFHSMANERMLTRFIGVDLNNFSEYNGVNSMSHCLYLNMFFAIGYIGIFVFMAFLYIAFKTIGKVKDKDVRFLASVLLMVFLIFGISMDPIEYTQISWFPFMYVGVAVSMISSKDVKSK